MIRTLLTTLGAGLVIAGVALAGASATGRAAGTTVKLEPPSQNVPLSGGGFEIDVLVEEVDKLGAFEFQVEFDPDLIEFKEWAPGPFMNDAGGTPSCPTSVSPDKDRVLFGCGVTGGGCEITGASGSGLLGTLHFTPKARGTSTLVFTKGQMSLPQIYFDANSDCYTPNYDLFFTITDGAVTVYDGATPTSVPATPVPNASRLTPTAVAVTGTPVGGALLGGTPASGVAGASDSSSRGGSTSPGAVATARAATGGVAGAGTGAPRAGYGPQEHDESHAGLIWGIALATAGAAILAGGFIARRRRSSYR
jgi:hypothetical protein